MGAEGAKLRVRISRREASERARESVLGAPRRGMDAIAIAKRFSFAIAPRDA